MSAIPIKDHAILRYAERTGRIDRPAIEREMRSRLPALVDAVTATGGSTRYFDQSSKLTFVIVAGALVTVLPYRKGRAK